LSENSDYEKSDTIEISGNLQKILRALGKFSGGPQKILRNPQKILGISQKFLKIIRKFCW
jgi:hypothetical protein